MARKHTLDEEAQIDMTPMLDVTFIMLIFFIVTTSFVKEAGVDVTRPTAITAELAAQGNIMVGVTATGQIWMQKRQTDLGGVRLLVEQSIAEYPESRVVIVADRSAPSGVVIQVMDQARLAGAQNVSIAAKQGE